MSFGSRLKDRREELGMKQSELGALLGVTGSAIGNYENGISSPKADVLYRVFDALKCDANYLFQDEMTDLQADNLTLAEIHVAKKYRDLDDRGKEAMDWFLDHELLRIKQLKSALDQLPVNLELVARGGNVINRLSGPLDDEEIQRAISDTPSEA